VREAPRPISSGLETPSPPR